MVNTQGKKFHLASCGASALLASAGLGGAAIAVATHFARQVLTPAAVPDAKVEVVGLDQSAQHVTHESGDTAQLVWLQGPDVELDGEYSFIFDAHSRMSQQKAGHARLGPVVKKRHTRSGNQVARRVLSVERGNLRVGARGRITGWWFTDPSELGYEVQLISLPVENGVSWGWVIRPTDARPGKWAVHVHGRGALPHETLRGVIPFAKAGVTSLVIAYRNDPGAPSGLHGRYGLGLAEQDDVNAAIGWAKANGATGVTLVGWSMGATACVLAAGLRNNQDIVEAMVLDSPALDWPGLLRNQARLLKLPTVLADLGMALLRTGLVRGAVPGSQSTDLWLLTPARLARLIHVPTLIHASPDDTFVPWAGALQVAQLRGSYVRLHPARGEHVKLWNVDPAKWEAETESFISELHASNR